ncbi:MAG: DNA repair protein RecO [Gemmatimonadetes bacterium]|nr:DNA repair protein RecO [Gemmatimonadota bacterium]
MPLISADALILQAFPYGETSKILRLLTGSHGVRSAIAKGALRPRSRFGGILEPFTDGIATLYLKESRELQTLSSFELARNRQTLGQDLLRFGGASLVAELVLRTASEEPDALLFEQVRRALDRLESCQPVELESRILAEVWALVGRLGFAPALETCGECGRRVPAAEDVHLDFDAGGLRCTGCADTGGGARLPARARLDLLRLCAGEAVVLRRTDGHWMVLSRFLAQHVLHGGVLHSLDFLADAVRRGACAG